MKPVLLVPIMVREVHRLVVSSVYKTTSCIKDELLVIFVSGRNVLCDARDT